MVSDKHSRERFFCCLLQNSNSMECSAVEVHHRFARFTAVAVMCHVPPSPSPQPLKSLLVPRQKAQLSHVSQIKVIKPFKQNTIDKEKGFS